MFYGCKSLTLPPSIKYWKILRVRDMSEMFARCSSLQFLPDISEWDTSNVNNIDEMFSGCPLRLKPFLPKWYKSKI